MFLMLSRPHLRERTCVEVLWCWFITWAMSYMWSLQSDHSIIQSCKLDQHVPILWLWFDVNTDLKQEFCLCRRAMQGLQILLQRTGPCLELSATGPHICVLPACLPASLPTWLSVAGIKPGPPHLSRAPGRRRCVRPACLPPRRRAVCLPACLPPGCGGGVCGGVSDWASWVNAGVWAHCPPLGTGGTAAGLPVSLPYQVWWELGLAKALMKAFQALPGMEFNTTEEEKTFSSYRSGNIW